MSCHLALSNKDLSKKLELYLPHPRWYTSLVAEEGLDIKYKIDFAWTSMDNKNIYLPFYLGSYTISVTCYRSIG